jgi:methyl-accepting chemotaxis protein
VNKAIQQLDQVIQQNASSSEEVAAAAEELSSQAEQLQTSIAFFKVDSHGASRGPVTKSLSIKAPSAIRSVKTASKPVQTEIHEVQRATKPAVGMSIDLDEKRSNGDKHDSQFTKF